VAGHANLPHAFWKNYMRYWNLQAAAKDLASGEINEWEKAKYLIYGSIASILFGTLPSWIFGSAVNTLAMVGIFISIAILVIGFIKLFNVNKGIDGQQFIERYVVMAFPANIKLTVLYWLAYLFITFWLSAINASSSIWMVISVVSSPIYYIVYFWMMLLGFRAYKAGTSVAT
jgi:hypothetical protein